MQATAWTRRSTSLPVNLGGLEAGCTCNALTHFHVCMGNMMQHMVVRQLKVLQGTVMLLHQAELYREELDAQGTQLLWGPKLQLLRPLCIKLFTV